MKLFIFEIGKANFERKAGFSGSFIKAAFIDITVATSSCDNAEELTIRNTTLTRIANVFFMKFALTVQDKPVLRMEENYSPIRVTCKVGTYKPI